MNDDASVIDEVLRLYISAGALPQRIDLVRNENITVLAQRLAVLRARYGLTSADDPRKIATIFSALETLRRLGGIPDPIDDWEHDELKKLYRALSRRYHSDSRFPGAEPDAEKFNQASAAWRVLQMRAEPSDH